MQVCLGQKPPRIPFLASTLKKRANIQKSEEKRNNNNNRQQAGRKNTVGRVLYRIGGATNPGPSQNQGKQSKLGDYFHRHHIKKDDRDMWCKEKGYTIEDIAGDGNCLYACLGRSRTIDGDKAREIIHDNADRLWSTHMQHDVD
eukprot:5021134-Heterocapsa_arctica.AAC.1